MEIKIVSKDDSEIEIFVNDKLLTGGYYDLPFLQVVAELMDEYRDQTIFKIEENDTNQI